MWVGGLASAPFHCAPPPPPGYAAHHSWVTLGDLNPWPCVTFPTLVVGEHPPNFTVMGMTTDRAEAE